MIAVSLFDVTGNMLKPWSEAGYECHIFDNQHKRGSRQRSDGVWCHGFDLLTMPLQLLNLIGQGIEFVSCFPPCTDIAVSGAKHFRKPEKGLRALQQSVGFFATSQEFSLLSGAPYLIENPVTTMSTYWRKPDHTFHPWEYTAYELSDSYSKKTCLWVGNGFVMPPPATAPGIEIDDRIHKCAPGPERANIRSATPMGFARACFEANSRSKAA